MSEQSTTLLKKYGNSTNEEIIDLGHAIHFDRFSLMSNESVVWDITAEVQEYQLGSLNRKEIIIYFKNCGSIMIDMYKDENVTIVSLDTNYTVVEIFMDIKLPRGRVLIEIEQFKKLLRSEQLKDYIDIADFENAKYTRYFNYNKTNINFENKDEVRRLFV